MSLILIRLVAYYFKRSTQRGFTLVELLVVTIIVGILAALSVPNLLAIVGRSREAEARNNLGALARSQQAYHFEKQAFANSMESLSLNFSLSSRYYAYPLPSVATTTILKQQAMALNPTSDGVRNYSMGIYFNTGSYDLLLCQAVAVTTAVDVGDTEAAGCTNGGIAIE